MDIQMVTGGSAVFENESRTLRHRRNVSNSSISTCTAPCVKCVTHYNHFSRSRSDNHYKTMYLDCGLSLKQKGMRRWKTLATIFVVKKAISEVNESANFSVNDKSKSKSSSQLGDSISSTAATSDFIQNKIDPTPEIQSDSSTAVTTSDFSQYQIDPTPEIQSDSSTAATTSDFSQYQFNSFPEIQGHEIFSQHIIAKATFMETGSWFYFKLICRMINLLIEVGVATVSQENEPKKLKNRVCWEVTFIMSTFGLAISILEFVFEAKDSRAVWQRRGCCYCYYFPPMRGQLLGKFSPYFGVIGSTIQFLLNLITVIINKRSIRFETWSLVFVSVQLLAMIKCEEVEDKCEFHGCALQCPQCVYYYLRGTEPQNNQVLTRDSVVG